jgi:hypothetical protein
MGETTRIKKVIRQATKVMDDIEELKKNNTELSKKMNKVLRTQVNVFLDNNLIKSKKSNIRRCDIMKEYREWRELYEKDTEIDEIRILRVELEKRFGKNVTLYEGYKLRKKK